MDLCPGILTALCKKEGQFDLSLRILFLNPLAFFTEDSLFCPSIIYVYMDAHCLSDTLLGSGDMKIDHVSLSNKSSGSNRRTI